jgi:hypothetical protein
MRREPSYPSGIAASGGIVLTRFPELSCGAG